MKKGWTWQKKENKTTRGVLLFPLVVSRPFGWKWYPLHREWGGGRGRLALLSFCAIICFLYFFSVRGPLPPPVFASVNAMDARVLSVALMGMISWELDFSLQEFDLNEETNKRGSFIGFLLGKVTWKEVTWVHQKSQKTETDGKKKKERGATDSTINVIGGG